MADITIRPATRADLPRLTEIYNHYVINTPITFDLKPCTVEERAHWFAEHNDGARYRMFVAQDDREKGRVIGFAGSGRFRDRAAYDTTVETTIYCAPEATGRGVGTMMYRVLLDVLKDQDINRITAGITMPNDASIRLHERFGFTRVGVFTETGRKFDRYWDVCWMERPRIV